MEACLLVRRHVADLVHHGRALGALDQAGAIIFSNTGKEKGFRRVGVALALDDVGTRLRYILLLVDVAVHAAYVHTEVLGHVALVVLAVSELLGLVSFVREGIVGFRAFFAQRAFVLVVATASQVHYTIGGYELVVALLQSDSCVATCGDICADRFPSIDVHTATIESGASQIEGKVKRVGQILGRFSHQILNLLQGNDTPQGVLVPQSALGKVAF